MTHRERLVAFYQKVNPSKLEHVDEILESFAGQEEELFRGLEEKYGSFSILDASGKVVPEFAQQDEAARSWHHGAMFKPPSQARRRGQGVKGVAPEIHRSRTFIQAVEPSIKRSFDNLRKSLQKITSFNALDFHANDEHARDSFVETLTLFQHEAQNFVEMCTPLISMAVAEQQSTPKPVEKEISDMSPSLAFQRVPLSSHYKSTVANDDGRSVYDVFPVPNGKNILAKIIESANFQSGDILVLHPGLFKENIELSEKSAEIRPAIEGDHGRVVLVPANPDCPVFHIKSTAKLVVDGLFLDDAASQERSNPSPAAAPLLCCGDYGQTSLSNSCLSGGSGGVVAFGSATVNMSHCTFRRNMFASVYAKDSSHISVTHCSLQESEVGVRVREATFSIANSEVFAATTDGIACHSSAKGCIEKCKIVNCKFNGILLSPGCEVVMTSCICRGNHQYGIYAPHGADFSVQSCDLYGNALGDSSRPPPVLSQATVKQWGGNSSRLSQ